MVTQTRDLNTLPAEVDNTPVRLPATAQLGSGVWCEVGSSHVGGYTSVLDFSFSNKLVLIVIMK